MAQQNPVVQPGTTTVDMSSGLGNLQSVGPSNSTPSVTTTLQSGSTVQVPQPQTPSNQQSSYVPQPAKGQPAQQSNTSSSSEFPQV